MLVFIDPFSFYLAYHKRCRKIHSDNILADRRRQGAGFPRFRVRWFLSKTHTGTQNSAGDFFLALPQLFGKTEFLCGEITNDRMQKCAVRFIPTLVMDHVVDQSFQTASKGRLTVQIQSVMRILRQDRTDQLSSRNFNLQSPEPLCKHLSAQWKHQGYIPVPDRLLWKRLWHRLMCGVHN